MKKLLILAILFTVAATSAYAIDTKVYISEPDSIFCEDYSDLQALLGYMQQGDKLATAKLFESGACAVVKPSLDLHIEETKGSAVRIRRVGMTQTLWTLRKFLR